MASSLSSLLATLTRLLAVGTVLALPGCFAARSGRAGKAYLCHDLQGQLKALQLLLACITGSGSWHQMDASTQQDLQEGTLCEVATQALQAVAGKRHIPFVQLSRDLCLSTCT